MSQETFPGTTFTDDAIKVLSAFDKGEDDKAIKLIEAIADEYSSYGAFPDSIHPTLYALISCAKKLGVFIYFFDFFLHASFQEDLDTKIRSEVNRLLPLVEASPDLPYTTDQFSKFIQDNIHANVIYPLSDDVMNALISMASSLGLEDDLKCVDRAHFYSKSLDPDHSPHQRPGGFFEVSGKNVPGYSPQQVSLTNMYENLVTDYPYVDTNRWYIEMLVDYAKSCDTVTELGVFQGVSTAGFLSTSPARYRGYDLDFSRFDTDLYLNLAIESGIDAAFIHGSSHEVDIEPVEFLFIDTVHTYEHVREEVRRHHRNVSKYIAIHDTNYPKPPRPGKKVREAAEDLVKGVPEWHIVEHIKQYTGMIILGKN